MSIVGDNFPLTRTPFTIAFWLKTAPGATDYLIPLSKLATGGFDGYLFTLNAPGQAGKATFLSSSNADRLNSTKVVNDGLWHRLAVTLVPGGDMILYLDGTEEARRTAPVIKATAASLRFGAQTVGGNADPKFVGALDEIQIHHTVLTADEIMAMVADPGRIIISGEPITGVIPSSLDENLLTWRAVPGWSYDIDRSATLTSDSWTLQATVTPEGQSGSYTFDTLSGERAYFRVVLR